jgi:alkanesulfonate monooxygenase SsuD/methylene tetrahydromethanopterin reductase-like flavin-dependent oxidoreductase (luciferase family)
MRFDSGLLIHSGDASGYPQIAEWVETVDFMEESGFTCVWSAEHHFFWDGWTQPTPTNPIQFGAFVASRTSRLRLGQCGVCLPDWHPIRVAEDAAMLDHMSGGRLEFGIMRGLNNRNAGNFNPDADRRDVRRNQALMWESYEIIRKAWTGEPFSHDGEFYRLPRPGWRDELTPADTLDRRYFAEDGELIAMSVLPTPLQKPMPPSWVMADSVGSAVAGAKRGLGVLTWGQSFEAARASSSAHREAFVPAHEGDSRRYGIMRPVFVAETAEQAEAVMRPSINLLMDHVLGLTSQWGGRKAFLAKDEELAERDLELDWYDFLLSRGWCLVGTPDDVTAQLKRFEDELGIDHLVKYWALPLVTHEQMMDSMRLFAREVMPNFDMEVATA